MTNKLLFLVMATCNLIYGLYEIEYNAAVEIKEIMGNNIDGYQLQYNINEKDPIGWNDFEYNNSETEGNVKYCASGINIGRNLKKKNVALRLKNNRKISDVHNMDIYSGRTNFIKISLENSTNFSSIVYSQHLKTLPYSEIIFHIKEDNNEILNLLRLMYPLMSSVVEPNTNTTFSWELISCSVTNATLYLVIGQDEATVLSKTNVTGLSEYTLNMSEYYFPCGKYWWMISVEDNSELIFCSEMRNFFVANSLDTDSDGYDDTEELARLSDPNDSTDIPLIIISDPVCSNAYCGQQYYNVLKVNNNKKRVFWGAPGILPTSLVLSREGVLFGIPREKGAFLFDIEALNEEGKRDIKRFYMNIKEPNNSLIKSGSGSYTNREDE